MTNESWQHVSQFVVVGAGILALLGGYGVWHFGKRIEQEKDARAAYSGELKAGSKTRRSAEQVRLSGLTGIWPVLEIGDSGAKFAFTGPQGAPLFQLAKDVNLVVVTEDGRTLVSVMIQDNTERVVAELNRNEWKVNANNSWDRNYTADSLEVKDPSGDIVLQVRALPDRIQLQAKLWGGGLQTAFFKMAIQLTRLQSLSRRRSGTRARLTSGSWSSRSPDGASRG
jgi:hypothetical protein